MSYYGSQRDGSGIGKANANSTGQHRVIIVSAVGKMN